MLVVERMTIAPTTVSSDTGVKQALEILEARQIRHLPVVDDEGSLVGILSEKDLLRADASQSVWDVMSRDVVTVTEYTPLEEAACIMADRRISSLPVMRSGKLVGIVTETDLFRIFLELLGGRQSGVRLTMLIPEEKGMLASLTGEIAAMGGNILSLGTFMGEDPTNRMVTVKVADVPGEKLIAVMEALGMEIVDVREACVLVRERMTQTPVTIRADVPITEALRVMRENEVRRLPVLDEDGIMIGIASEKDLLYASPSPATSLSIHEMHYLLSQLRVAGLMTTEVISVTPDTPLEEAARIMADNKIGGLPVVSRGQLVGIITETDIFKVFLELLGARETGIRLTMEIPERKGEMARITTRIARLGGNIRALGTFLGDDPTTAIVTVKVDGVAGDALIAAMQDLDLRILHSRATQGNLNQEA